jgi:hypothetical protein
MKCVKLNEGRVVRVSNKEAEILVRKNEGTYCPKSEWKKAR